MSFGFETSAEEAASALAQHIAGRNVLITGATPKSLGAECARVLAKSGAGLVVLAGRNRQNLEETSKAILAETPGARIRLLDIDLADFDSVRKAAKEVSGYHENIDVLINNSGIMAPPYRTFHNLESQFATNHVGHFLFTNLILPKILATPTPRIVNVTSVGHTIAGVQFDDLNFGDGKNYHPWKAYGQSKSANILFTRSLAAKHSAKLLAFAVHPGVITTNLRRDVTDEASQQLIDMNFFPPNLKRKDLGQGAATHIVAAFDPSIAGHSGAYMQDCAVDEAACAEWAKDMGNADRLWTLTNEILGESF